MKYMGLILVVLGLSGCSLMVLDQDNVQRSVGSYDQTYDTFRRAQEKSPNLTSAKKEVTVQIEEKTLIQDTVKESSPIEPVLPQEELK